MEQVQKEVVYMDGKETEELKKHIKLVKRKKPLDDEI